MKLKKWDIERTMFVSAVVDETAAWTRRARREERGASSWSRFTGRRRREDLSMHPAVAKKWESDRPCPGSRLLSPIFPSPSAGTFGCSFN